MAPDTDRSFKTSQNTNRLCDNLRDQRGEVCCAETRVEDTSPFLPQRALHRHEVVFPRDGSEEIPYRRKLGQAMVLGDLLGRNWRCCDEYGSYEGPVVEIEDVANVRISSSDRYWHILRIYVWRKVCHDFFHWER